MKRKNVIISEGAKLLENNTVQDMRYSTDLLKTAVF